VLLSFTANRFLFLIRLTVEKNMIYLGDETKPKCLRSIVFIISARIKIIAVNFTQIIGIKCCLNFAVIAKYIEIIIYRMLLHRPSRYQQFVRTAEYFVNSTKGCDKMQLLFHIKEFGVEFPGERQTLSNGVICEYAVACRRYSNELQEF